MICKSAFGLVSLVGFSRNEFCHEMYLFVFKRYTGSVEKNRPAFERLLLPKYISNDILQYFIK